MKKFTGLIAGYDPGGNDGHGFALADLQNGQCVNLRVETLKDAESVILALEEATELQALGIDTLAAWATGSSGWRAADLWLRKHYKHVLPSIVSPNSLHGSMGLNGMAVLQSIRKSRPHIQITETHPKVLYWALTGSKYNYREEPESMDSFLSKCLGCPVKTKNNHEWDAVLSVVAALRGFEGTWTHDLFKEPMGETGRLVFSSGEAKYWWPE